MGASDFVQHSLEEQELESDMFSSWQEELHNILPLMKKVRSEFAEEYIKADEVMPWEVIGHGIKPVYLWAEYQKALAEKTTVACDTKKCTRCGVCREN